MAAPDPEAEAREQLRREFLDLGFTETEAKCLAAVWADPAAVSWAMHKHGMSHYWAARIYS